MPILIVAQKQSTWGDWNAIPFKIEDMQSYETLENWLRVWVANGVVQSWIEIY